MKAKNVLITTVISLITLTLGFVWGVKAEGSSFVSKGRIQSGDIIFDSSDFETIENVMLEHYEVNYRNGLSDAEEAIKANPSDYGINTTPRIVSLGTRFIRTTGQSGTFAQQYNITGYEGWQNFTNANFAVPANSYRGFYSGGGRNTGCSLSTYSYDATKGILTVYINSNADVSFYSDSNWEVFLVY